MKFQMLAAAVMAGMFSVLTACQDTPVQRVNVPSPTDATAYRPVPMPKPLPGEGQPGQPMPGPAAQGPAGIQNEEAFVSAYAKRSPRIMIFVNRTILGDSLPPTTFQQVLAGAQIQPAGLDQVTDTDYAMIESSLVQYFDHSGRVRVQDSDIARARLNREQLLRIENGDPAANKLLATELQQDVLIRVMAAPTRQASNGAPAVRLIAKAVSTSDARILGNASVDMPLPMGKTNINIYTRYLAEQLMGDMATKWSQPAQFSPIEVRIYKAGSLDDTLKIRQWLQATKGVSSVRTNSATGGSTTAYASFAVAYDGAPEDLYADLRSAIGMSQGLKAVDLQNTTIDLEVSGPMNLVTTTRHTETTVETRTTEDQKIEPINPAPVPVPQQ